MMMMMMVVMVMYRTDTVCLYSSIIVRKIFTVIQMWGTITLYASCMMQSSRCNAMLS